jgi:anti-sigma regulatory factor (Ser/Thr protein kinase)
VAVLVYRHPPADLHLTVSAEPENLAVIRNRLRRWLPSAAISSNTEGDVLLAVGEAAANATEHATRGASHTVQISITARLIDHTLALTVADDGRWQEPVTQKNRGHGIALMKALLDKVDITPTDQGTTVEMVKELAA